MSAVRNLLGTALSGSAQVLSVASKVLDTTAKTLRPSAPTPQAPERVTSPKRPLRAAPSEPIGTEAVIADVIDDPTKLGRIVEPPPTPVLDETPHLRTAESHIEELALKPANQVVAAVNSLSTDELRLLTEYETSHKNRSTVLTAIEKAVAPGASGAGSNGSATDEIILPDAGGVPTSGTLTPKS